MRGGAADVQGGAGAGPVPIGGRACTRGRRRQRTPRPHKAGSRGYFTEATKTNDDTAEARLGPVAVGDAQVRRTKVERTTS